MVSVTVFFSFLYLIFHFYLLRPTPNNEARYFHIRYQKHSPSTQHHRVCNHAEMFREKLVPFIRSIIFATSLIYVSVQSLNIVSTLLLMSTQYFLFCYLRISTENWFMHREIREFFFQDSNHYFSSKLEKVVIPKFF